MPVRATKRGAERTRFASDAAADVLICGASFAGLAVARELRASGAKVLVLDRYEIGERQTSACAAPTEWLENLGLSESIRQTFGSLLVHTPQRTARWALPWTFSTFDYRTLCRLLWEQGGDASFETAKVDGRTGNVVHTDRGDVSAPLIVDALGWRRVLGTGANVQPPDAGSRSTPRGAAPTSSCGSTAATSRRDTAGRSPRATSCGSAWGRSTRGWESRTRLCCLRTTFQRTPCASRATGSRTGCGPRPRAACSSSATRPATACR
jgi:hypothetical protein